MYSIYQIGQGAHHLSAPWHYSSVSYTDKVSNITWCFENMNLRS